MSTTTEPTTAPMTMEEYVQELGTKLDIIAQTSTTKFQAQDTALHSTDAKLDQITKSLETLARAVADLRTTSSSSRPNPPTFPTLPPIRPRTNSAASRSSSPPPKKSSRKTPKVSLPPDFSGDRRQGRTFWNACLLY